MRRVLTAGIMTLVCGVGVSSRALMRSVIFHVVARACGSRKTFRWSLWGLSYLSAAEFLWAIAALLGRFGNPALVLVLCSITIEVWTSLQATVLAQEHHGLELRRATLAGWATWVVYALCLTCSCALTSAPISLVAATP